MNFKIATLDDTQVIAEIYNEHIKVGGSTMDLTPKEIIDVEDWFSDFNERELIVLLEVGMIVVGWGIIKRYSDREGYARACETAIYLKTSETRKGYGSHLKLWLIDKCRELGYHHMVAKIYASNIASIEYNRKLGYEIVGTQKEIGFINGEWQDVTIMQLII
ncbi:MAG: N-acetyltransferase family protein [Bacteroidota bacterium]